MKKGKWDCNLFTIMTFCLCLILGLGLICCVPNTPPQPQPQPRYYLSKHILLTCVGDYEFVIYNGNIFQIFDNEGHGIPCKSEEQQ